MDSPTLIRVPALTGGVSSQPDSEMFPNQVKQADNWNFWVECGMVTRPGTALVAIPSGLTTGKTYHLHAIMRDEVEEYVVIYGNGTIKVLTTDGEAATVNISSDAQAYLNVDNAGGTSGALANEMRLRTNGDETVVINTNVEPAAFDSSANYTVTASYPDYYAMSARIGTPDAYYEATDGTDDSVYDAGFWQYMVASADNGWAHWLSAAAPSSYQNTGGKYDEFSSVGFRVRFQKQALTNTTSVSYTAASNTLTFDGAGHGYAAAVAGDKIRVATGAAGLPAGYYDIVSRTNATQLVIDPDSGVGLTTGTAAGAIVDADCVDTLTVDTIHSGLREVNVDAQPRLEDMYELAHLLTVSLQAGGGDFANGIINWQPGSGSAAGKFQIVAPYRGTGTAVTQIISPTTGGAHDLSNSSSKPFYFSAGSAVNTAGSGSPSTVTQTVNSRWESVAAPGQTGATIDASKMPMLLRRTSLSPLTFELVTAPWKQRTSGDADSNPGPDFLINNTPIEDCILWRDRFIFGAGEMIETSQAGDRFNLWNESTTLVDSDPIKAPVGKEEVANIRFIEQVRDRLVVQTKAGGFYESTRPEILKQGSLEFLPSLKRDCQNVRPVQMGQTFYFASNGQDDTIGSAHAAIAEYLYDDRLAASDAPDLSRHAFEYLPQSIRQMAGSADLGVVMLLPDSGSTNHLYRFQTFLEGPNRKQASWNRWIFSAEYVIGGICAIRNDLFMLVEDDNQWTLERITMEKGDVGAGSFALVAPTGELPVAVLSASPTSGDFPLVVTFDASGSSDSDGTIVNYEWDFDGDNIYGETGAEATAAGDSTPATVTFAAAGTYVVGVRVTDDDGNTAIDHVTITVTDPDDPVDPGDDDGSGNGVTNQGGGSSHGGGGSGDPDDGPFTDYSGDIIFTPDTGAG